MPELPEIESIRRALERAILGKRVMSARIGPHDMRARGAGRSDPVRGRPWMSGRELLVGGTVASLMRRGKQLAIVVDDGRALVVQLGMSGQVLMTPDGPRSHRHVEWVLAPGDGSAMVFRDPRRFGGLVPHADVGSLLERWDRELGPDALDARKAPIDALRHGTRTVKSALLDQALVAGIGNIYADEALHAAGIRPTRRCHRLTRDEASRLLDHARRIMRRSVSRGGTSLRDHVLPGGDPGDARRLLRAYGRAGLPCRTCGSVMRGARLGGRATAWCTSCQR